MDNTAFVCHALCPENPCPGFPDTRFQGSKKKLLPWLYQILSPIGFDTALDAFGGTGAVSYLLKKMGKQVAYNDLLGFNHQVGRALIQNSIATVSHNTAATLLASAQNGTEGFIYNTFSDIYYTDEENRWLDAIIPAIHRLKNKDEKALCLFALYQACIIKRPYNLFHRKNLYLRLATVKRGFGNKKAWDTPFETHFQKFLLQANHAVFDNHRRNEALNQSCFELQNRFDLVYIDTPYISQKGNGVDYLGFYHFLEGLTDYENWAHRVDYTSKHRRLSGKRCPFTHPGKVVDAFERLFEHFRHAILAVSYRSDGIPDIRTLEKLLKRHGKKVSIHRRQHYRYALSRKRPDEVLLLGE